MLVVAILAGCGSSSSKSSTQSSSTHGSGSQTTTSAGNGIAAKAPAQIVNAAIAATRSARSVHVQGNVTGAQTLGINLRLRNGTGATGSISENGVSFRIVVVNGGFYFQGDRAFWLKVGHSPTAARLLVGRWLRSNANDAQFAGAAKLASIRTLLPATLANHGTLTKGATATVGGQPAIAVHDAHGGTIQVATTGRPYVLHVSKTGAQSGSLNFDDYNQAFTVVAPKHALNASQLEKLGG